mgnify:CR=1 FL=1
MADAGLVLGTAGLPHILMRFFTVADAKAARKSVFYATGFIGYFYVLTFIIGFGAIVFLMDNPAFYHTITGADGTVTWDKIKGLTGGTNMAAIHLADAVGGSLFLGFISAVAFATILAVVAGLTLAGASAVSHDLYYSVFARGRATDADVIRISKISTVCLGIVAIILGYIFENQNVAFMVGLVFAVAASANFPIIYLSVSWRGLTARGAVAGSLAGLVSALTLVTLSPGVWTTALGLGPAPFPYDNPALFSVPLAFVVTWAVSRLDRGAAAARSAFDAQYVAAHTGFGRTAAPAAH